MTFTRPMLRTVVCPGELLREHRAEDSGGCEEQLEICDYSAFCAYAYHIHDRFSSWSSIVGSDLVQTVETVLLLLYKVQMTVLSHVFKVVARKMNRGVLKEKMDIFM